MDLATKNGWQIILPARVRKEVIAGGSLDSTVSDGINNGKVIIISGNSSTFSRLRNMYGSLGDGELEAISIACDSGANQHLILSDDNVATKIGKSLGIKSLGISGFMTLANKQGLLCKVKAIVYMNILMKNRFLLKQGMYDSFLLSLV